MTDAWQQAVIDQLMVCGIYRNAHDTDPRKAISDVISWNVEVALDPRVSEAARKLSSQDALDAALDLIADLRSYTHNWDYKYGEEWDRKIAAIATSAAAAPGVR